MKSTREIIAIPAPDYYRRPEDWGKSRPRSPPRRTGSAALAGLGDEPAAPPEVPGGDRPVRPPRLGQFRDLGRGRQLLQPVAVLHPGPQPQVPDREHVRPT